MGAKTLVTPEEYLSTDYSPDVDYVDGVLEDRNVGEKDHGKLQLNLAILFRSQRIRAHVFIETRLQVKATRWCVPDICVYLDAEPEEQVFTQPPFICIEILSPEDRLKRMFAKCQDYLEMGVPNVWLLDPWEQKAYRCDVRGVDQVDRLETAGGEIRLSLSEVFA